MPAPVLIETAALGTSLRLRYSEALADLLPSAQRFVVTVNGRRNYLTGQAVLSADKTTILLKIGRAHV